MKKIYVFLFILSSILLFQRSSFPQWSQLNSGTTEHLRSIYFFNENTGYVAGNNAIFLLTTNGGTSWNSQTLFNNHHIFDIYFFDQNTGLVAGKQILKTTNAGLNWFVVHSESGNDTVNSFFFTSNLIGYASINYDQVIKTVNGGNSWSYIGAYDNNFSVYFTSSTTGYVCGDNQVWKTTNEGINWNSQWWSSAHNLLSIIFTDINNGFMVGSTGDYFKTTNAGNNWIKTLILSSTDDFYKIKKSSDNKLYVVGETGTILMSSDLGITWIPMNSSTNKDLLAIYIINNNVGYIVGKDGIILKSTVLGINTVSTNIPKIFTIYQNYPNPFNPSTKIRFDIPKTSFVKMVIYDVLGKEVATLVNVELKLGTYEVEWDGLCYPSGVYFYKIQTDDFYGTKSMILVK
jgi:photosystem II stability/assembly factor-like uncharacterized protein